MEDSDSIAVARVKAGDGNAYRLLVERHSRGVFRLAFRMTGNEQDSEDVVQETFLRAYKQLHRWEERSSFSTWIYRIAANYSLDLVRRKRRHAEVAIEEPSANPEQPQAAGVRTLREEAPGPDRLMFSGQVKERLTAALDELSQQERSAFVLRHFEGCSIEEIGGTLGLSSNAAKHSIFRAVAKIRRALEPLMDPIV